MKNILIEGMDGAGKTSVCRKLAEKLGYEFVEKPWHFLLDDAGIAAKDESQFETYRKLAGTVNKNPNRNFTSMFYALGSIYMYERFKDSRIVTDRHLASNYAWSGTDYNSDVYDLGAIINVKHIKLEELAMAIEHELSCELTYIHCSNTIRLQPDKIKEELELSKAPTEKQIQAYIEEKHAAEFDMWKIAKANTSLLRQQLDYINDRISYEKHSIRMRWIK